MKKLYRCKVCGYISERSEPPEVCPACGFKGKIFEEYESPVSAKRRMIMKLHIHPVMTHFPLAFVLTLFLISLVNMINIIRMPSALSAMAEAIVWLLPCAAVIATLSGLYDGWLRFKRANTPLLKKKIFLSSLFILLSISLIVLLSSSDLNQRSYGFVLFVYAIVLSGIGTWLGLIGGRLIEAKVKG